jgi:hypothetical protein
MNNISDISPKANLALTRLIWTKQIKTPKKAEQKRPL